MNKHRKWSEQLLVEQTLKIQENGKEVDTTRTQLLVCTSGIESFKKNFVEGKHKDDKIFQLPFDMIVLAGDLCPAGKFYELEYLIGETGTVYRALFQLVEPVSDIRTVLSTLRSRNILPKGFNPYKAYLRDDIDDVCVGSCNGDTFHSSVHRSCNGSMSISDYCKTHMKSACLYYYRGDLRELWANETDVNNFDKVFISGGDNVNDAEFADMRVSDIEEAIENIDSAADTFNEYKLMHMLFYTDADDKLFIRGNIKKQLLIKLVESLP